jgi:hypothetical protein
MAWLENKGGLFRIRFRFGGCKHLHALKTSDRKEAQDAILRRPAEAYDCTATTRRGLNRRSRPYLV